jgi:AAA15 family ATPase/GTPase
MSQSNFRSGKSKESMKYLAFEIENYRAITDTVRVDLSRSSLVPIVGINECGKTTVLQAIFCFDFVNDSEYEGRHLTNIKNLYRTDDPEEPVIRAELSVTQAVLRDAYHNAVNAANEKYSAQAEKEPDETKKASIEAKKLSLAFPESPDSTTGKVIIERNIASKKYRLVEPTWGDQMPISVNAAWAKEVVRSMPYILYNDDFMDRPPNSVEVPKERPEERLTGWLAIYERLFMQTDMSYSLFSLSAETDSRRRESILSDVKAKLNKTLTKDWSKLSVVKNNLAIDLKFHKDETSEEDKAHLLEIRVVERIDERERYFDVIDRSKDFFGSSIS